MNTNYSVGIPVRNEENTISQTLESLLKQTIKPQKIHVCVNGSSDNTYNIVSNLAKAESSINMITSEPGKPNAWNKIVKESLENNILFCDGDVIVNNTAAENLLKELDKNSKLVLVGGSNAYFTSQFNSFFSKYFTENLKGKPIKQDWICGRLYITKINELSNIAKKYNTQLIPKEIINEDGYLDLITTGHNSIIENAFSLSMQVSTFSDWKVEFKRILAGQKQLKTLFPEYTADFDLSKRRLKNYIKRFKSIKSYRNKLGVTSLFLLRQILNSYYTITKRLDYNQVWIETKSTKVKISN